MHTQEEIASAIGYKKQSITDFVKYSSLAGNGESAVFGKTDENLFDEESDEDEDSNSLGRIKLTTEQIQALWLASYRQEDIAEACGCSRETVAKEIEDFGKSVLGNQITKAVLENQISKAAASEICSEFSILNNLNGSPHPARFIS